ncbi:snare protein syntaxin 18/UFE1 [Artomyces pyxidatus]|uniref:Snare protein syntaxin 18/UFE1 n=1 Tax=Artomyces pyxidatus TaxID=48021 RepID=A0ACB8SIA2_9AGAM|nr:snare protein syntaxin 18/UFE1 [Artomyces pyxidatus]
MAVQNLSTEFRGLVDQKSRDLPNVRQGRKRRRKPSDEREGSVSFVQEYMKEAYTILNHINTLTRMLANIRRPYLDVHSRPPPPSRLPTQTLDFTDNIKYLSNEERDQIDMQARVILSRCADRVKEMELSEKHRSELAAKQTNPLLRLLPARLKHDSESSMSDFIAAHNSGVTWYLTRRLAEVSQSQKDMQEERVRRQTERTRTLGSGAAREALYMSMADAAHTDGGEKEEHGGSWLGNASSSLASSWAFGESSPAPPKYAALPLDEEDDDDDDDDVELSASQIQQFESENAQILRSVEDTLASVQQAEARLLEISALQMELVAQLTRQTEVTDQLYEDAIASSEFVEKGNVQLREARRRARDGRMWILLFLIGASLSLLFLHYY